MKKKLLLISVLFVSLFVFAGCGGSDNELVGTWKGLTDGESRDMQIETTFTFKSGGDVVYSNEFGLESIGTYEFKVDKEKLSLTATDVYSPSYSEMTKQK